MAPTQSMQHSEKKNQIDHYCWLTLQALLAKKPLAEPRRAKPKT